MANDPSSSLTSLYTHLQTLIKKWVYDKTEVDNKLSNKENTSNKTTQWSNSPDDSKYPSEKLVKDSLDSKASTDSVNSLSSALSSNLSTIYSFIYNLTTDKVYDNNNLTNIGTTPHSTQELINSNIDSKLGTINSKLGTSINLSELELIDSTHSLASTANWTGTSTRLTSLTKGTRILYRLTYVPTATSQGANLSIKFTNNTSSSSIPIIFSNGTRTYAKWFISSIAKNDVLLLEYDGTNWVLLDFFAIGERPKVARTGSYNDLSDKPTIPTIPTNVSAFNNDSGYLTSHQDISGKENTSNKTSSWNSTTNNTRYPTEKLVKDSLDGKANSSHTHTKSQITDFPAIPSKTSELTNDSGFLTSHQSLSNYYNKSETNNYDVDFILGTQTASTSAWTGTTNVISSLRAGTTIFYKLPYASTSTSVTLNLTLKGGGTTGAKNVFYKNTTRLTTHFGVGQVVGLTYDGTAWYVISPSDNNSNNDNNYGGIQFKAGEALTTQTICCAKNNGQYYKVANGVVLDIRYPLIMTSTAVTSGTTTNAMYRTWYGVNIANTKSMTLTDGSQLFLEGTAYSDGKFTISSNVVTHTLTNGRYYIKVGTALSTTQIRFISDMTVYYYNGTTLKPVIKKEQIVDFPTIPSKTSQITDSSAYNSLGTSSNATQQTINNAIENKIADYDYELTETSKQLITDIEYQYVQIYQQRPDWFGLNVSYGSKPSSITYTVNNTIVNGYSNIGNDYASMIFELDAFGFSTSDTLNITITLYNSNNKVVDFYSFSCEANDAGSTISNINTGNTLTIRGELDSLNNSIANLVQIQSVWFDFGSLTVNSSSTKTKTVKPRPDGMNSAVIPRIQNFCSIQTASVTGTNFTLTAQNQSNATHNCNATVLLVYFPSSWSI